MKCAECRQIIDQLPRDGGPLEENGEVAAHLRQCELCREYYRDLLLARALREEPVPDPDEGFADRVMNKAMSRWRQRRRARLFKGISAAAAMLMVFFAGYLVHFSIQQGPVSQQPIEIVMSEGGRDGIRILIETKKARKDAILSVDLEGNVALRGVPGRRSVQWRTDLVQGRNLLELPVEMQNGSGGTIRVGYRYGSIEKEVSVRVKPTQINSGRETSEI